MTFLLVLLAVILGNAVTFLLTLLLGIFLEKEENQS